MHSKSLKSKQKDIRAFRVVGDDFMMLDGKYPAEQQWFSFMDRAVYEARIVEPPVPYVKVHFSKKEVFAKVPDEARRLIPEDVGDGQLPLPFAEGKRVSRKQFAHMKRMGCKTWDRKPNGDLYSLVITNVQIATVTDWCLNNCHFRFNAQGQTVTFESVVDAISTKLKFIG